MVDWNEIGNFKREEFICKCGCKEENMNRDFVKKLDKVRNKYGFPIIITSGYRCKYHDSELGGKGNHTTGKAVDIKCDVSQNRYYMLPILLKYFKRIGIGKTFIHVDDCDESNKPQEVVWVY